MKRFLFLSILLLSSSVLIAGQNTKEVSLCAQTEVYNTLLSPSTARFVSTQIMDSKNAWYIVYVVVDSQNSFGAVVRSGYLSCIQYLGNRKYQTVVNGTQETGQERIDSDFLALYKSTINWNNLE